MIHNQDDYIQQQLNSAQIVNTIRHSRYFLISILLVCLYIFCIYQLHYHPADNYLNLWFILTEMVVCMCWLISTVYFKPNEFKLETAHRWLQIQCLLVGICISTGILPCMFICRV